MEMAAFVLKKLVSVVFYPVPLVLFTGLAGYLIWRRRSDGVWGRRLVLLSLLLCFALSLPLNGWLLLRPLESMAGDYADPEVLARSGVKEVVILGGGVWQGKRTPGDGLNGPSLRRLLEGVRLWRGLGGGAGGGPGGARLVLSGGAPLPGKSEARIMADLALQLGLPKDALVLETGSLDTAGQARKLAARLQGKAFALVTSAAHMPRSLAEFSRHGLNPLPAPADFRTKGLELSWNTLIPQAAGFSLVRAALHEYLGLAWFHLKRLFA